jgi:hypothetical protein
VSSEHTATHPSPAATDPRPALEQRLDPQVRKIVVGVWTAELIGDELANISYGGRPVLRAIKAVVRDHEWRTLAPSVRDFTELTDDDGLSFRLHVDYEGSGAAYEGMVMVRLTPAIVEVTFSGRAKTAFRRNRIGLVVLHPTAEAGRDVSVVSPDGSVTTGAFPTDISPGLVFTDISSLEWADAGTAFDLGFSGDTFETEDQRNWTDGSFKTYSTPSALPIPVDVAPGDTVQQSVSLEALSIETPDNPIRDVQEPATAYEVGEPAGTVPPLALFSDSRDAAATVESGPARAGAASAELPGLDAVLVELYESRDLWAAKLAAAAIEAGRHGAGLDVRVVSSSADGVPELLAGALGGSLSRIRRLGMFHPDTQCTDPAGWAELKKALEGTDFSGLLIAGTRSHFTELNRWIDSGSSGRSAGSSPVPQDAEALSYSLAPQVHSTEVAHIVETLPVQRVTAANALRLGDGRPVHVGPITLKPRFHAPDQQTDSDELQDLGFTAAWTLASIHALTLEGVASVTYFETTPPRGITVADGSLNPAGELLQRLAACKGDAVLAATQRSAGKSPVTVYPVRSASGLQLFAGNLGPRQATATLTLPGGTDAGTAEATVFGAAAGGEAHAAAGDGGTLTLVLGPRSTAVVTFGA